MSGCSFPQCYMPCKGDCPKHVMGHTDFCKAYLAIRTIKERHNAVQKRIQDDDQEERIHDSIRQGVWPSRDRRANDRNTTGELVCATSS